MRPLRFITGFLAALLAMRAAPRYPLDQNDIGLCARCRHGAWVVSGRGSRFMRCNRSFTDPDYPKYPALPVLACPGFEEKEDGRESPPEGSP